MICENLIACNPVKLILKAKNIVKGVLCQMTFRFSSNNSLLCSGKSIKVKQSSLKFNPQFFDLSTKLTIVRDIELHSGTLLNLNF